MKSPYLRAVVVARCNPVRWIPTKKGAGPPMSVAEALTRMTKSVRAFDPKKIRRRSSRSLPRSAAGTRIVAVFSGVSVRGSASRGQQFVRPKACEVDLGATSSASVLASRPSHDARPSITLTEFGERRPSST